MKDPDDMDGTVWLTRLSESVVNPELVIEPEPPMPKPPHPRPEPPPPVPWPEPEPPGPKSPQRGGPRRSALVGSMEKG
jgi:hypothetical protein